MNASGETKKSSNSNPYIFNNLSNSFNHEKLSEMLDYIIKMPPAECSHDRGHKYPFTVSELFACEISQINELFFTAPPPVVPKKVAPVDKDVSSD